MSVFQTRMKKLAATVLVAAGIALPGARALRARPYVPSTVLGYGSGGKRAYDNGWALLVAPDRFVGPRDERERIKGLSEVERYKLGIEHLEKALAATRSDKEQTEVKHLLGRGHNKLYLKLSTQGKNQEALEHIEKAVEVEPNDGSYTWNYGRAAYDVGRYDDAATAFEKARDVNKAAGPKRVKVCRWAWKWLIDTYQKKGLEGDSSSYEYALREADSLLYELENLSMGPSEDRKFRHEILVKKGMSLFFLARYDEAAKAWDEAKEHGELHENVEKMRVKALAVQKIKNKGDDAENQNFFIRVGSGFGKGIALRFLDLFEAAYLDVGEKWDLRPSTKIQVNVLSSEAYEQGGAKWSGAHQHYNYINIRLTPGKSNEAYRPTIYHEYSHLLAELTVQQKHIPRWFDEGLAMACETNSAQRNKFRLKTLLKARLVQRRGKSDGAARPLTEIATGPKYEEGSVPVSYATAYFAGRLFLNRHGGFPAARKILKAVGEGTSFAQAFFDETQVNFANYEIDFWRQVDEKLDRVIARMRTRRARSGHRRRQGPNMSGLRKR